MEWCTFVVSNSQSVSCTLRCFNTHHSNAMLSIAIQATRAPPLGPKVSVQLGHQACLSEGQPFLEMEWCTFVVSNSQSVSCTLRCFNTHIGERGACLSVRPVVSLRPSGCVSPSVRSSLSVCLVVSLRMCALAGRGPSAGRIGGPDRQAPPGTARHRPAPPGTARHRSLDT